MSTEDTALFGVEELAFSRRMGRVEAALHRSLTAAQEAAIIGETDAGLAAAALVAARALDAADAAGGPKMPYAIQATLTPYRECLHALRLPAALAPAQLPQVAADPAADGRTATPDWLSALGDPD